MGPLLDGIHGRVQLLEVSACLNYMNTLSRTGTHLPCVSFVESHATLTQARGNSQLLSLNYLCVLRSTTGRAWSWAACTRPGPLWPCWARTMQWWAAQWSRWTPPRWAIAPALARARHCARCSQVRMLAAPVRDRIESHLTPDLGRGCTHQTEPELLCEPGRSSHCH